MTLQTLKREREVNVEVTLQLFMLFLLIYEERATEDFKFLIFMEFLGIFKI